MREYRLAYDETKVSANAPENAAIAWVRTGVEVVCEYFAIRAEYVPHPAGEDLLMVSWCLDHMATGYRLHGGGTFNPVGRDECETLARSLATAPIDWATFKRDGETPDGFALWFVHARTDAATGKVSPWPEHSPCKETGGE